MKDIIIIGAGGQGRETAQLINDINCSNLVWNLIGFVDDIHADKVVNGLPILGPIDYLKSIAQQEVYVVCAIGNSKDRKKLVEKIMMECPHLKFATLVHPSAVVGDHTSIGLGNIICAQSVITVNIKLGDHILINYASTVGHDCIIGDFCTILPGVNISGNVSLLEAVEIGSGAVVIPGIEVGKNTVVGAGAVVVRDLPANCTAVGVPAKPIKFLNEII